MKKKLAFRLLTILLVFVSCSSESDSSTDSSSLQITVQTVNSNSATVSWNAIQGNGEVTYTVYLDGQEIAFIGDLNYTFLALNQSTTYTIKIEAEDGTGQIITSTTTTFTTSGITNQIPSNFTTSVKHLGHVSTTINWSAATVTNSSPITYSVFVANQLITSDLTDTEFYIPNLQPNTTYQGVVRAFNGTLFKDSNFSFTTVPYRIFTGRVTLRTQQEVDAFEANHYTEITNWLIIGTQTTTSNIIDLGGLQSLVKVTGSLFVSYNPNLLTTQGLQNISNDLNAIAIVDNLILNNLIGFSGVNKLLEYINIEDNPEITSLDHFSGMTTGAVNVNVDLTNNDKLVDIDGLSQLNLFSVYIRDNQILANINLINGSDANSLGQLTISGNPNLNNFSPLSNITLIKGDLTLGFCNMTNLDFLSNLGRTFGDVNIFYNSALTNLCGLQNIVQNNQINGSYNVQNNAYNPTFQNINSGNCSL